MPDSPMPDSVQSTARPMTQAARLARMEFLRGDAAKLEGQLRELQEQIARLLDGCEHTDANGRSAVMGGRTKVCAHCGRIVSATSDKLWG